MQHLRKVVNEKLNRKDACISLGLTTDNNKVNKCLLEASTFAIEKAMQHLFVSILLECQLTNPLQLWNAHKNK